MLNDLACDLAFNRENSDGGKSGSVYSLGHIHINVVVLHGS